MNMRSICSYATFFIVLCLTPGVVQAQTQREQAEKELKRPAPNAGL